MGNGKWGMEKTLSELPMTPGASSRETLAAVAHGGNPQDRAALPTHWLPNAQCPMPNSLIYYSTTVASTGVASSS
ncbi:hypothetical protein [Tolypothrix sp. VBCCA 56010]|uniref:hypothetical protein n=1 Tax=Tolypothrix sp. VBCCA 56010 TaxID=3137731 RepID=UPI003D7D3D69